MWLIGGEPTAIDLLWPTLLEPDGFRCMLCDGHLAIIVLDAPGNVADDELDVAAWLHHALGRGLLVVL